MSFLLYHNSKLYYKVIQLGVVLQSIYKELITKHLQRINNKAVEISSTVVIVVWLLLRVEDTDFSTNQSILSDSYACSDFPLIRVA